MALNTTAYVSPYNCLIVNKECKTSNGLSVDEMVEKGPVLRADTLEALAEQMGADPAVLTATVERFNAIVDAGKDDDFGRVNLPGTLKVTEGPFYATPTTPAMHHTMGGVHIDTQARALDASGDPIPGLYAAGEVAGGFHGDNRVSGNAILEALGEGMVAGADAASK